MENITSIKIEYLEQMLDNLKKEGKEIISLEELHTLLTTSMPKVATNEIDKEIKTVKEKIEQIRKYMKNKTILLIYKENLVEEQEKKLEQILSANNQTDELNLLIEFSKELDKIIKDINSLISFEEKAKEKDVNLSGGYYRMTSFEIFIDDKTPKYNGKKTYHIYDYSIFNVLIQCKLNRLKKLLKQKLSTINFKEIFINSPIYLNEKQMTEFLQNNKIDLSNNIRYDLLDLFLKNLMVDEDFKNKLNKEITLKEISENNEEMKVLFEIIGHLEKQGFKGNGLKLVETLNDDFQEIEFEEIQNTSKFLISIILEYNIKETIIYSTLQTIYNSIDKQTKKKMHEELLQNKPIEATPNLNKILEIMKKYARNKDGNLYTDDEIMNFLRQKNQIRNSTYKMDSYDYGIYSDTIDSDVNAIMDKITGRRH